MKHGVLERVFIVIPVANEEASIEPLLRQTLKLSLSNMTVCAVMDRFSQDSTRLIIQELEREYSGCLRLLFFSGSTGVASCYLHGFKYALQEGATSVLEMDAGGSHQPSQIPIFLKKLEDGYDCVFGSRFISGGSIEGHPFYRKMLSRYGTLLANVIVGTRMHDMTSGFEAFRAEVLRALDLDAFVSQDHFFQTEMRYYCRNFRTIEVPIHYMGGRSTLNATTILRSLYNLFRLRFQPNGRCSLGNQVVNPAES